ncbi:AI-2E family transporter [Legionella sp. PC997]|uniref:AI-2E family transporter n=1 Tax=Legionella sp. PC997 TaxID=2755562 RepID=UPI0015FB19BD|nr:AI-2E family transporter [Legionella sp. PC997]QMT60971.1 AI-2E family transporter [Legionella sp. PC997]
MKSSVELKILVVLATGVVIALSQYILFPILLSFFLYLLVSPLMEWLSFIKMPRILASALISIAIFGVISLGITFLVPPASNWIENAPRNFKIIEDKFRTVKDSLGEINKAAEKAQSMTGMDQKKNMVVTSNLSLAPSIFNLTTNIVISIGTVLILLFFYLIYFQSFIQKIERVLYNKRKSLPENPFLLSLKNEVSKYLFTFLMICFVLGAVMSVVFWLLNLPNPLLWGVMAMFLTFIPYLGHMIGIIIVLFVSLITFDSYLHIFAPPALYFLITALEGQLITPIFLGKRLKLNPLLIFLNILIWTWLWGAAGALISVPLLVTVKITLEYIPELSKYAILLEK